MTPIAIHILNSTPRRKPGGTQWSIVLPAMLLVCGAIWWGLL